MRSMHNLIPQEVFKQFLLNGAETIRNVKKSAAPTTLAKFELFKAPPESFDKGLSESKDRQNAARALIKALAVTFHGEDGLSKAGVTTSLGYNFYDLRAPVRLSYPVNVPFRNMLQRVGRENDGYGTAAHWKATRNPGIVYAGVTEGQRNAIATPDENDYTASYKEIGVERGATFTSQFAGEGFADNVADEHIRGLHELWLQEEGLMLNGNSGTATGNNGFALGTANTPTGVLAAGTGFTTGATVSAAVVFLTAMGNPQNTQYGYGVYPSVANGITPSYVRTNADGSTNTINGGTSAISAMSAVLTTTGGNNQVTFSVVGKTGVYGYAWFINTTDATAPTLANARLAAITFYPSYTATAAATGTQTGAAAGLNVDHSYNATDFDGLLTYAASTPGATYVDLKGASLTSQKNGRVTEVESILETIWLNYQTGVDAIWASADAAVALDSAIRYSGTTPSAFRFEYTRDGQNNLLGGFVVSAYQSRFGMGMNGANAIPIRIHPMLPAGTLYFDVHQNPYPQSRAPYVRAMLVQRDYYSIEWPIDTRQWTFGTYTHEVLAHEFPWLPAVLTGIGLFNQSN
jgi:hypothetical protein